MIRSFNQLELEIIHPIKIAALMFLLAVIS